MGLISDCENYFKTKNLYEVLGVTKEATDDEIKRCFRRSSLKYHPDRFPDANEDEIKTITSRFQALAKVYYVLTDKEKRSVYDASGVVIDDDVDAAEANWMEYWRCLFPEITTEDIDSFMEKYVGSEEEKNDLKDLYIKYEGDLDHISECMIGYDENRHYKMVHDMVKAKEVPAFDKFSKEPKAKREKRLKKAEREAKAAEREAKKREKSQANGKEKVKNEAEDDLVKAIQLRSASRKSDFNSMINRIAAKYGGDNEDDEELVSTDEEEEKKSKKTKRPKQQRKGSPKKRKVGSRR